MEGMFNTSYSLLPIWYSDVDYERLKNLN